MIRVAIGVLVVILVILLGALSFQLAVELRAPTAPQVEYSVRQQLSFVPGFQLAQVSRVKAGWSEASAQVLVRFALDQQYVSEVVAQLRLVRVDGAWRILAVQANGRDYPSLTQLGTDEVQRLRNLRMAHRAEVAARTAEEIGRAVVETGKAVGDRLADAVEGFLNGGQ